MLKTVAWSQYSFHSFFCDTFSYIICTPTKLFLILFLRYAPTSFILIWFTRREVMQFYVVKGICIQCFSDFNRNKSDKLNSLNHCIRQGKDNYAYAKGCSENMHRLSVFNSTRQRQSRLFLNAFMCKIYSF
jgi:hypothetical protein